MNDYDFSTLNDKEFENISIDLISKDKEKRFERFKAGRDGGIDGRFYHTNGSQEIIQCKHYLKTGFNGLISSLKKKNDKGINEIGKVKKLNPLKYIFTTSLPLNANDKKIIKELFAPYIHDDNDIYGQEDLNVILSNYSNIEEKYYKLWISSTTVLSRIMNNAIKSRSEALVEDIQERSKYYVITDNHNKAIEILEKSNVIIIAGEPGIGKTTLAKHMAIFYIEKDFECYDIENPINEAEAIFEKDKKQIFYFDDFLGSNYLEALENKKDSHIIKFIDRVKRDKTKRFILTSRTNIFNQSILLSDTFKSKNIDEDEFIISIDSLKEIDRAYILYNHIWHSDLEEKYIDEIYKDKRYKNIINHKNFSPRIIEFITDTIKIKKEDIKATDYWNYLVEKLNNPQDIWKQTFDKGSNDFIRAIVTLVVLNGNKIEENELRNAYNFYIELADLKNNSNNSKEFESVIEEVVKYFLNRTKIYNGTIEYSLFNPSIADFIFNRYKNNEKLLINIFLSLETKKSLQTLMNLNHNSYVNNITYIKILSKLIYNKNTNINYLVPLVSLICNEFEAETLGDSELIHFENKIHEILKIIINSDDKIANEDIYLLIQVVSYPAYKKLIDITPELMNKLILSTEDYYDTNDLEELLYFLHTNEISLRDKKYKNIFYKLKDVIEHYLTYHDDVPSYPKKDTLCKIEEFLINDIKEQTKYFIRNNLKSIGFHSSDSNIQYIQSRLNYQKIKDTINNNIIENIKDRLSNDLFEIDTKKNILDRERNASKEVSSIDEIDELFER